MYTRFFQLSQLPFSIAPDPRYLYMSERHREALAHLLYGIGSGGGFVLLTGEIGAGKTTVCRCFLEQVPPNCKVAYIFNPKLTVVELLQSICDEFGIQIAQPGASPGRPTIKTYVDALTTYLLAAHAQGRNNLLVIDEAQNLDADVLEQLRLLTNLETNERKLLQIVLIGQPELRAMLAAPGLEQLAQRVIARYHLEPLSEKETALYIAHRLAVAGLASPQPFRPGAVRLIHQLARGVPRRINLLCDRAMLGAYVEGRPAVDRRIVRKAAREVFAMKSAVGPNASARRTQQTGSKTAAIVAGIAIAGLGALLALGASNDWKLLQGMPAPLREMLIADSAPTATGRSPPSSAIATSESLPRQVSAQAASPGAQNAGTSAGTGKVDQPARPAAAATQAASAVPPEASTPSAQQPATGIVFPAGRATDDSAAFRRLARSWNALLPQNARCDNAQNAELRCYRSNGGIDELRRLDRPAVVTLQDDKGGRHFAVLTGLSAAGATLEFDGAPAPQTVSLVALGRHFRGEFATFWQSRKAFRDQVRTGDRGEDVDWIASQLARQDGVRQEQGRAFDTALAARVRVFQAAQGIDADGVVGPRTYMRLNQAAGISEPRLAAGAAVAERGRDMSATSTNTALQGK